MATVTHDDPHAGIDYPPNWHELLAWSPDDAACLRFLERRSSTAPLRGAGNGSQPYNELISRSAA